MQSRSALGTTPRAVPVRETDLLVAFEFVSAGDASAHQVFLSKQAGKLYWHSDSDNPCLVTDAFCSVDNSENDKTKRDTGGNPASQPSRRAVADLMQIDVTAPALPRALSRLAAAPYDACEKRAGRVNGLAFTDLWE